MARRIIIIGYSFRETDAYFRYLLPLALENNLDLERIYVVDAPGLPVDNYAQLKTRYTQFFGENFVKRRLDFSYVEEGLVAFVKNGRLQQLMGLKFA